MSYVKVAPQYPTFAQSATISGIFPLGAASDLGVIFPALNPGSVQVTAQVAIHTAPGVEPVSASFFPLDKSATGAWAFSVNSGANMAISLPDFAPFTHARFVVQSAQSDVRTLTIAGRL